MNVIPKILERMDYWRGHLGSSGLKIKDWEVELR